MEKPSVRFSLNTVDFRKQLESAAIFLAPSVLALLTVLTPQVQALVPDSTNKALLLTFLVWGLNQVTGLIRRFIAGKEKK